MTNTDYQSNRRFDEENELIGIPVEPTIATEIQRYAIEEDGTVSESASGLVPGTLKNSFSIDEYDGSLRIATENSWGTGDRGTSVYVLQQSESDLKTIGGVTGLAPGESVYAVRFAGDRGYVVTFRRVDPLFVIDLSEPTAPTVEGELKIPGYSQYLHVLSEDHVLGVGRDADEETGLYEGLTVSLFNVSDPADPTLQDRYLFDGGRSTFSPFAEDNPWDLVDHHAISYFAGEGILALPFYSKEYWRDEPGRIFESPEQSAVRTFRIDPVDGISVIDTIEFDSRADRALRVGDLLYSMSPEELKVSHLTQPDGVIAELSFERDGADDFVDMPVGEDVLIDVLDNDGIGEDIVEILAATLVEGVGEVEILEDERIKFTSTDQGLTPRRVHYTAKDAAGTLIDAVATIDPDLVWQNARNRLDINDDGKTSPRDALNIINLIDEYGFNSTEELETLYATADGLEHYYADTTGDQRVTPGDALKIIDWLAEAHRQDAKIVPFELDQPFDLAVADVGDLNEADLLLSVTDVIEDSRCPIGTTCVWEGQVRATLDVVVGDELQSHELVFREGYENPVQSLGYSIQLTSVSPDAETDSTIELNDYVFTLLGERAVIGSRGRPVSTTK